MALPWIPRMHRAYNAARQTTSTTLSGLKVAAAWRAHEHWQNRRLFSVMARLAVETLALCSSRAQHRGAAQVRCDVVPSFGPPHHVAVQSASLQSAQCLAPAGESGAECSNRDIQYPRRFIV
jgi:hypothetical protein